jgi:hypothetical protein
MRILNPTWSRTSTPRTSSPPPVAIPTTCHSSRDTTDIKLNTYHQSENLIFMEMRVIPFSCSTWVYYFHLGTRQLLDYSRFISYLDAFRNTSDDLLLQIYNTFGQCLDILFNFILFHMNLGDLQPHHIVNSAFKPK